MVTLLIILFCSDVNCFEVFLGRPDLQYPVITIINDIVIMAWYHTNDNNTGPLTGGVVSTCDNHVYV